MPFRAGTVVLCTQGNRAPAGRTHSYPQNAYALDFAAQDLERVEVVASARGRVSEVFSESTEDSASGGGYGNYVRLDHGDGVSSFYAHLDQVSVTQGQVVRAGQALGTMGRTGMAYDRHLHFALDLAAPGATTGLLNIPIAELVAADVGQAPAFRKLSSLECVADLTSPWSGHLYASENDGSPTLVLGAPRGLLRRTLVQAAASLRQSLSSRLALERLMASGNGLPAGVVRKRLSSLLAADPENPVALYQFAVLVEMRERAWHRATQLLSEAERFARVPRRYEVWLPAWIENQRGVIAMSTGREVDAKRHFQSAAALWPERAILDFGRNYLGSARESTQLAP